LIWAISALSAGGATSQEKLNSIKDNVGAHIIKHEDNLRGSFKQHT
jgi:hypothetical protein